MNIDIELDTCGLNCPLPILKTKKPCLACKRVNIFGCARLTQVQRETLRLLPDKQATPWLSKVARAMNLFLYCNGAEYPIRRGQPGALRAQLIQLTQCHLGWRLAHFTHSMSLGIVRSLRRLRGASMPTPPWLVKSRVWSRSQIACLRSDRP